MATNKTRPSNRSVRQHLQEIPDERQRRDAFTLLALLTEVTGEKARLWGDSIVGFGQRHYRYASGREGDWFVGGFAARKGKLTLYLSCTLEPLAPHLRRLGKHRAGKGCVYLKSLDDVDPAALRDLVTHAARATDSVSSLPAP